MERPSDCGRWIACGLAVMIGDALSFTEKFFNAIKREQIEYDPTGFDDGVPRRWVTTDMAKQLKPIREVGTGNHVTKRRDMLRRRHGRARTILPA